MGTWLIFQGLRVCDGSGCSCALNGLGARADGFQEIAPAYRPYPKPTQVDW